mmetsp:Transcript_32311/g.69808  ORF Transcript_32311/g.69808 Transcript_32311/m.69808 type:complete len:381 (+) Transcript_32311:41-1183(+)
MISENSFNMLDGPRWAGRRRLVFQCFSPIALAPLVEGVQNAACNPLVKAIHALGDRGNKAVDIDQLLLRATLDSISEVALGGAVGALADPTAPCWLLESVEASILLGQYAFTTPFLLRFPFNRLPFVRRSMDKYQAMRRHALTMAQETRRKGSAARQDMLKVLTTAIDEETGEKLTDMEVADEVCLFFTAGTDTTAHTMAFTLYYIARHTHVQRRIAEEVQEVLGQRDNLDFSDLKKLRYLDATIKESLRVMPTSASGTDREAPEATTLAGRHIKKGQMIQIPPIVLHYNDDMWHNPTQFEPERFLQPDTDRHPSAFQPFSGGRRNCTGRAFAMMEATLVLAELIRHFRWVVPAGYPQLKTKWEFTVVPVQLKLFAVPRS